MPDLQTYDGVYLWKYVPNLPGAAVFAVVFSVLTIAHGWRMSKTRSWFCIPFVVGGVLEVIGYITRALAYNATGNLILYILQATFLLLPAVLFAATLYMVYSRVVRSLPGSEAFSPLPPRRTTLVFVLSDIACLNIQSTGAGMLSHHSVTIIGDWIVVSGLGLQIAIFLGFVLCCGTFHRRWRAHLRKQSDAATPDVPWQATLNMLYSTSLAILVRNVYRVVEFVMGQDGYLQTNEWPAYVFDAALMVLVMLGFLLWYPSQLHMTQASEGGRESMVELKAPESGERHRRQ